MGELQRSAFMSYLQVAVPKAVAENFAHQLGRNSCMMVTDLNEHVNSTGRTYMRDIIRCKEAGKTVSAIETMLEQEGVEVQGEFTETDLAHSSRNARIEQVEDEINKHYRDMKEQLRVLNTLRADRLRREHHISTVVALEEFEDKAEEFREENEQSSSNFGFKYISGVVSAVQKMSFRRQVYLISRGNSYTLFKDIEGTDDSVYIVYYLGEMLDAKIAKLCNLMGIEQILRSDQPAQNHHDLLSSLTKHNAQTSTVINSTQRNLNVMMRTVNEKISRWKATITMEMSIRVLLNKFEDRDETMTCQGWVPTKDIDKITESVVFACRGKGVGTGVVEVILPPTGSTKPTHFETNKFTATYQSVVNTYGVPRYREYNPTPPTIITFPFMFAMMYGDVFHGSCVFLCAAWLIWNEAKLEKSKRNEMVDWLFCGRYLLILMGFFAIFNGFIYNEVISLSIEIFGKTPWKEEEKGHWIYQGVYPFGIDPAWHGREAQITFTNSVKMKLSVIFGVAQMTFGLLLSALNHYEYRDWISLTFEWIPQLFFMLSFFVYMDFMIIYKWCINWQEKDFNPPSLITALVNMVLAGGKVDAGQTQLFESISLQEGIQFVGMLLMLGSIPVMLLAKPIALWYLHGRKKTEDEYKRIEDPEAHPTCSAEKYTTIQAAEHLDDGLLEDEKEAVPEAGMPSRPQSDGHGGGHGHGHGDGEFDFMETFIHQMIHTIEYVLGTISNTASYLRLWALSLAHSQLSEVFYTKTLLENLEKGPVATFIGASIFFVVTFGVLLVMDQLECFLHALRLHWVEFQNKFYNADGVLFEPFSYRLICKPKET